jgi:hypothetical protein
MAESTKAIIKSSRQILLETGCTYGRRCLQRQLNSEGYQIGIHRILFNALLRCTTTLMNKANIKAIWSKKRHYYPNTGKLHKRANNL